MGNMMRLAIIAVILQCCSVRRRFSTAQRLLKTVKSPGYPSSYPPGYPSFYPPAGTNNYETMSVGSDEQISFIIRHLYQNKLDSIGYAQGGTWGLFTSWTCSNIPVKKYTGVKYGDTFIGTAMAAGVDGKVCVSYEYSKPDATDDTSKAKFLVDAYGTYA
jgi:hypothetical protein